MKKETALKRLEKAIRENAPGESPKVIAWLVNYLYDFFLDAKGESELETYSKKPSDSEELAFTISFNIYDDAKAWEDLLNRARKEASL